jgi:rod shape-determining protein MreD
MLEQKSITKIILLYLFVVFLAILNLSNIKIAGFSRIMPLFDLMAIFYFVVLKDKFGLLFVFILGIWNDALSGNLLGLTSLCYIILIKSFILFNNRILVRENFIQIWQQFVVFCFLFLFVKWTILVIMNGKSSSVSILFIQLFLSSFFYILMHRLFDYLSAKLLGE